ncbi:cytochrome P450 [Micromonospora globbae]|uniref:Cytochrome P450 n=1 Tax=Micromonospora globbae TaxID=1894969 RepID=A0ABZ1SEV7_9ACTN|nr:cytochrome P450 [Micromonospora globbae]WTF89180.1 cytochrome P450 [Micromonospora globbae]
MPLHQVVPSLLRDPARALIALGNRTGGELVRINVGSFRPYLVTHPRHVQHVLRERADNYERAGDGLFWRPVKRLFGEGILGEGQIWSASRRTLQPMFTAKRIEALVDGMAEAIREAVDELDAPSRDGRMVDIGVEQSRIVCRAIMKVLFGDKISVPDAMRVVDAQDVIATAVIPRIVVPFAPLSLPMPGDRPFRRAKQIVDDVLLPIVRASKATADEGDDVISTLWRARTEDGRQLSEQQVRNDTVAMFAATTETTINVLTWLWPHLDERPDVAERLYEEIARVVGDGPVRREHLTQLPYTRMVLDELLRLYPIGWIIPRRAVADDVIDGVEVEAGATMVASPLITQRMAAFWDRPDEFDPDRFVPERVRARHRYAHFPFGGGPHQCLGMYLFYLEAQLILATMLSRYRFRLRRSGVPGLRLAAALRPRTRVELTLVHTADAA